VGVQIDQARQGDEPVGVDHGCAGAAESRADLDDHAVRDDQVSGILPVAAGTLDQVRHRASSCDGWACRAVVSRSPDSSR
jgi:hypothetical protein